MTLIVGIVCKDAIAVASDSQTTYGEFKTRDAEKIRVVKFKDLSPFLVAHSGAEDISNRVLAVTEKMAKDRAFEDEDSPVKILHSSMHSVREELRHQHGDCSATELRRILQDSGLDSYFMLAYYYKRKPFLFTFRFQDGVTTPARSYHASIGIGAAVSNFIVSEFSYPGVKLDVGMSVAIYAAKKVTEHVPECDTPIRAAWIKPVSEWIEAAGPMLFDGTFKEVPHRYHVLPQETVEATIRLLSKRDDKIKKQRVKFIEETFQRAMERFLIEYTRSPDEEAAPTGKVKKLPGKSKSKKRSADEK